MKLIDLLVQELPEYGGWPEGADCIHQDHDGGIYAWTGSSAKFLFRTPYGLDESIENMVTRNQYKSVFALSQKPAWNGEGLPPIGMHCEIADPDGVLMYGQGESGEVIAHVENTAVIRMSYGLGCFEARFLRPARSEAEKNRDTAIEAMQREADEGDNWIYSEYEIIYDAIAAGKIPGVKLEG